MISYAITTHNEGPEYIKPLIDKLIRLKLDEDEIVVVDDYSDDARTIEALNSYDGKIKLFHHRLDGNFAIHKNYLNSVCKGSHIFQLDGDENVHDTLIKVLPEILMMNPTVDLFTVTRINVVTNITQEDVNRWGWRVNDKQYINYPDRQTRIYKNKPTILWEGKVHERITGDELHADLPEDDNYSMIHIKTIERQRSQNELYDKLLS